MIKIKQINKNFLTLEDGRELRISKCDNKVLPPPPRCSVFCKFMNHEGKTCGFKSRLRDPRYQREIVCLTEEELLMLEL